MSLSALCVSHVFYACGQKLILFEITPNSISLKDIFMIDFTKTEEDLDTSMLGFRLILC